MIGKNFGNYIIESKIGEGGMGVVYRAKDSELDRPVAIKMVLPGEGDSEEGVARFMREAKAASRLQHPSIMTIYQFGVQDGARYLVMEFIEGKTLKRMINSQPMPINQICEIAIQVADALSVAHENGVVHRDMKAENIMVTSRGQAKILDFGLAKLKEEDVKPTDATVTDMYKTQVGTVLGTVSHMSPEQAMGQEVDGKTDIFSFGVVMYEMATGYSPFIGPSPQATLARLLNQTPTPISQLNPAIHPQMEQLINFCLEKAAANRPTAKDLTIELKKIQDTLSGKISSSSSGFRSSSGSSSFYPQQIGSVSGSTVRPPVPLVPVGPSSSGSGSRIGSGTGLPGLAGLAAPKVEPISPAEAAKLRAIYNTTKALRLLLRVVTLTVPFSFLLYFMVMGGLIRAQIVDGTFIWNYTKAIVIPFMAMANAIFTVRMKVNEWDFMLAGLALVAFGVRHLVLMPFDRLEQWAKTRVVKGKAGGSKGGPVTVQERVSTQRLSMLREYSEAQKILHQGQRHLAFLSIDVVGSTRMKVGEDKLMIEHAFVEYKKFVERILKGKNVWKVAWTPDGVMCAFSTVEEATRAAQSVLSELPWFNDGVHKLRTPFNVRCGINSGEVNFPEDKSMEEISDEVIDVAGHMQKFAVEGSIWIGREAMAELNTAEGFNQVTTQLVDGRTPFEWRPVPTEKSKASQ